MRPRPAKYSGRYRSKQQSCPQYLRSTWPTIHPDHDELTTTDMATILAAMKNNGIVAACSARVIQTPNFTYQNRKFGRNSPASRTSSTPALTSLGDTDDTEDEGFPHRRCSSVSTSSHGSCECLRKQATSMGSLSSSYSSLGERSSTSTLSSLDDFSWRQTLSTSLKAILDPDFSSDYDNDPKMRRTVEDIVSPKARMRDASIFEDEDLAAVDSSVLVALPGRGSDRNGIAADKYAPTNLCDLSGILRNTTPLAPLATSMAEAADSPTDLAMLRVGSLSVNDEKADVLFGRRGWDIPDKEQDDEVAEPQTTFSYQLLSEASESDEDFCCLPNNLTLSNDSSSASSWTSRSRLSSLSSCRDSSDYLADISSEETTSRRPTVWPPAEKLKLQLESNRTPFVLTPRIPGVPYYGVPTSILTDTEGSVSSGLEAFFKNRSIVHRLGPHGLERVYDMEPCPERCGFAYPVPPAREVLPTLKI